MTIQARLAQGMMLAGLMSLSTACGHTCKTSADCPTGQQCLPSSADQQTLACCVPSADNPGVCPGATAGCNPPCTAGDTCASTTGGGQQNTCCAADLLCAGVCCYGSCVGSICQ